MKKRRKRVLSLVLAGFLTIGLFSSAAYASEVKDEDVQSVIEQLEAIDSLQEMQNKKSEYSVKSNYYDTNTTDSAIITEHETARAEYESYVANMFAARIAAKQAYDTLNAEQQAMIDTSLIAKLDDELPTTFLTETYEVTPRDDVYVFEAVKGGLGLGYEVSHHMVSGQIPQTFILVDTSNGATSWTPNGRYVYGESNYEVVYCCDVLTPLAYTTDYKRVNLEDSDYYSEASAKHIRAILQNSYPYVTLDEMKANMKANGLNAEFVDSLTRSDIISAVQMAVWTYANANDGAQDGLGYFASINLTKNTGIYFYPLHNTDNECWDWLPGKRQRSYDARAAYRVNNLAYYLCNLPGVEVTEDEIIISDVKVTRADLEKASDELYNVGMYVYLNKAGGAQDNLKIYAISSNANGDKTDSISYVMNEQSEIQLSIRAKAGDTIKVYVEGTQYLARGVYFYEPEGGRDVSQSLVGVGEGTTKVKAEETFIFNPDITDMGLRIYKTEAGTGYPISDVTFDVYKAEPGEGESLSDVPTEEEIAVYATEENKVGSVVTDVTGYAALGLDKGTYLVVEQHNAEKVKAPVAPFYIMISEETNIVSAYPKNETVIPPEEPPIVPPTPDEVYGDFTIKKHDSDSKDIVLEGAEFAVYRPATESDANTEIIECDGVKYAVVSVEIDGEQLVLVTDVNGQAVSPELPCGTYYLVETKAPAGYNQSAEAIVVTVTSNLVEEDVFYIANEKGLLLPETGGAGTTGFMIVGGILVLAAIVLFVAKKRMRYFE